MNAELRRRVMARDRRCVLAQLSKLHQCRDTWGNAHLPSETERLTIEHVREHPGGKRRDEYGWLVAMCARANEQHEGSTTENRALLNAYLLGIRNEVAA